MTETLSAFSRVCLNDAREIRNPTGYAVAHAEHHLTGDAEWLERLGDEMAKEHGDGEEG